MGHFESIKAAIDAKVNTNGRQAITGHILNNILHGMLDSIDVALADEVKKILGDVSLDYDTLKEIADYIAIDKGRYAEVVAALTQLSQTDTLLSETITTLTKDIESRFVEQAQTNQGFTKSIGALDQTVNLHDGRLSKVEKDLSSQSKEISTNSAKIVSLEKADERMNKELGVLADSTRELGKDVSQLKVADSRHEENVARLINKVNFYVEKLEYLAGYIKPQSSYVGYGRLGYSIIGGSRENVVGFAKIGYAMIG